MHRGDLPAAQLWQAGRSNLGGIGGNEIATPRQVGARNDTDGYYPMLQIYYKVSPTYLN
jgi:hypothetical protein